MDIILQDIQKYEIQLFFFKFLISLSNQSDKRSMIEGRLAKNMSKKASATFCFTCASLDNHCE
jgi:hypothetical protein